MVVAGEGCAQRTVGDIPDETGAVLVADGQEAAVRRKGECADAGAIHGRYGKGLRPMDGIPEDNVAIGIARGQMAVIGRKEEAAKGERTAQGGDAGAVGQVPDDDLAVIAAGRGQ